uniref:Putative secreted protein n=1 Tax=Anopheles triannulatus TaxID=58253 RepID=A0A2M4B0U0_9DIPT
MAFRLARSIPSWIALSTFGQGPAAWISLSLLYSAPNSLRAAIVSGVSSSFGAPVSRFICVLSVISIVRNFRLSPTKNALLTNGSSFLTRFST